MMQGEDRQSEIEMHSGVSSLYCAELCFLECMSGALLSLLRLKASGS